MRKPYMLHVQAIAGRFAGLVMLNGRTVASTAQRFTDRNAAARAALRLIGAL